MIEISLWGFIVTIHPGVCGLSIAATNPSRIRSKSHNIPTTWAIQRHIRQSTLKHSKGDRCLYKQMDDCFFFAQYPDYCADPWWLSFYFCYKFAIPRSKLECTSLSLTKSGCKGVNFSTTALPQEDNCSFLQDKAEYSGISGDQCI